MGILWAHTGAIGCIRLILREEVQPKWLFTDCCYQERMSRRRSVELIKRCCMPNASQSLPYMDEYRITLYQP